VPVFGVYSDDRGYLEGRALLGGKLTLRATAAFDYLGYYVTPLSAGATGRSDSNFAVDAGPEYQFTRWLIGGLGYTASYRASSLAAGGPPSTLNFLRHEVYGRITFTY
jgi:hypothetical protein